MIAAPPWLVAWLTSGDAILLVIGLIMMEAVLVAIILRSRAIPIIIGLIPGLCLAAALFAALAGAGVEWIGLWLSLSLPVHLVDLRLRWRSADRR